jgi:hypothetical protein
MWSFIKKEWAQITTKFGSPMVMLALAWPFVQKHTPGVIQQIAVAHPSVAHWLTIAIGAIGAGLVIYREQPKTDG